ncbi:MAG TPA: YfhO family protein [Pyrinomonadaceae bacterium]|nr:YfhO family protein [Pyrinomonadaceae bacterium]
MTRSSLRPSLKINVDSLGAILVTLTPLVYFNAALRGEIALASEDGVLFNVPLRIAAANIMRQGSLPLWNPYLFSGMPLHAAAQGGLLFPLNWFYLFFDAPTATNLMTLTTYMVAALGAYLYARRSGSSPLGAIVTSLAWQWCGFMIGQFSHVNIVQTAALLPWLLWTIDGYGTQGKRRWALGLAAIVMLQAFTGHQQTLVYSLLLATAYAILMWRAARPARTWYLWSLVLLAAGMLLAAVQILPTYELMRNSLRARASFDFFTAFSLPPRFLLTFFAPYLMGGGDGRLFKAPYVGAPFYGEFIGYVGLATLMLAVVAIVWKRDARTKFWAVVAVIAFVLALGRYWPFKLYGIVYYVPILNLFRVPARHLMEVDLALAVLAGRGLTALAGVTDRKRAARLALRVGIVVLVLTFLIVTLGRPAAFRLAREAPVTLLRAPELFLPLFFAACSVGSFWWYARSSKATALCLLIGLLALDLCVWGQTSGWRVASPSPDSLIWGEPPPLKELDHGKTGLVPYRILTFQHPFDPNQEVEDPLTARSRPSVFWLQPNIYMTHATENAAGYDGFGLARYSKLAGDMAVWGELPKPDQTLRGPGRELDILNVRYLLAMISPASDNETSNSQTLPVNEASPGMQALPATETDAPPVTSSVSASASRIIADERFAAEDLRLPSIGKNSWLVFEAPSVASDRIALLTNLSWSLDLPDGTPVARVTLRAEDGRSFDFDLRVGEHTSEWSYDRPDIRGKIKNRRAKVATSFQVKDSQGRYQGHTYLAIFKLPERAVITGGDIKVLASEGAPDLSLSVHGISLADGNTAVPLRSEWISRRGTRQGDGSSFGRWLRVGEVADVSIFENTRVLPRAWLASSVEVLRENDILETIRTSRLPNGNVWDPRRTVLVENANEFNPEIAEDPSASAAVIDHQPTRVQIRTTSAAPSFLVLSENFYPGWHAYVDGESTEILRVNYNLRGLQLREGEHVVEFVYRPYSVLIGVVISILTVVGLVLWSLGFTPAARTRKLWRPR